MNAMRHLGKFLVLAVLGAATASCGDVVRSGRAPVFLVIDTLTASQGAAPGTTAPVTNARLPSRRKEGVEGSGAVMSGRHCCRAPSPHAKRGGEGRGGGW